jgi:TRAP-type mannitol/chloroaromatic compound transport system substrate-binding protein
MNRRSALRNAGIASVLATGLAPAVHAQATVRWRLASSFPKSLDTIYGGAEVFSKAVKALSAGRFEVVVHAAGALVPAFDVLDAVQSGTVEMAHTAPYYFYGRNQAFALGSAIPFGFNARQMNAWMLHGNGRRLMDDFYAGYNLLSFAGGNTGTQMGGWYLKEIRGVSDFKGMRMRLGGGLVGDVMTRMARLRWTCRAATFTRPCTSAALTPRNGSGLMTTRNWGSTRSRPTITIRAGGRAGWSWISSSTARPTMRSRPI